MLKLLLHFLLTVNLLAVVPDENPVNCLPFNSDGTVNYDCVEIAPLPFTQYTILSGNFPNLYPYVSITTAQTINEDNANNISYTILFVNDVNVSFTSNPSHGTVEKTATQIIYTPNQDYNGIDTFTISFSDDIKGVIEKIVTITIDAVNDIPEITMSNEITLNEDSSNSETFSIFDVDGDAVKGSISINPSNGTAIIIGSAITYTPNQNFNGIDTFDVYFNDGNGGFVTKTISVNVEAVNDAPIITMDLELIVNEDSSNTASYTFIDVDTGDNVTATEAISPDNGTIVINGASIAYTPTTDYFGTDSFTVTLSDGNGADINKTISVSVINVNDAPVITIGTLSTVEDNNQSISFTFSDIDSDSVDAIEKTAPLHGEITIDGASITYTPIADYNGLDSFVLTMSDRDGSSEDKTISVIVEAVNDAPVATPSSFSVVEDTEYIGILLANDIDADTLTYSLVVDSSNGATLTDEDGSFTYIPNQDYNGTDSFTFRVHDGYEYSEPQTVSITVTASPDKLILKQGWTLTLLPTSSSLYMPETSVVWHYSSSSQSWQATSETKATILTEAEIPSIDTTSSSKAYWVLAYDDFKVSLKDTAIENFNYDNLTDGWHMLGSYNGVTDFTAYLEESIVMWMYSDGIWTYRAFTSDLNTLLGNLGYSSFTSIPTRAGFWLYKEKNKAPLASFTISPDKSSYYLNEDIKFTSTSTDANNDAITLSWNFLSSTDKNVSTSYPTAGTYDITLTATDSKGDSNTTTKSITIIDEVEEPDLSIGFATPKIYTFVDDGSDMTFTITKNSESSFNVNVHESFYDEDFGKTFTFSDDSLMTWDGKGYGGLMENNNVIMLNETIYGTNIQVIYTKEKQFNYIDLYNTSMKEKDYRLYKIIYTGDYVGTEYYKDINDDTYEVTETEYNTLLNDFDIDYEAIPIQINADFQADVFKQILIDLGYESATTYNSCTINVTSPASWDGKCYDISTNVLDDAIDTCKTRVTGASVVLPFYNVTIRANYFKCEN